MDATKRRIKALQAKTGGADVLGVRFYDSDMISVRGVEMPLAEFDRLYPDAVKIHLVWSDEWPPTDN